MALIEIQRLWNVFFGSPSIRWWLSYRWVCGMYKNEKPRCKECKATDFGCEICKCRSSEQEKQANIKIPWAFYFDHAACSKNWIFIRKLFSGVVICSEGQIITFGCLLLCDLDVRTDLAHSDAQSCARLRCSGYVDICSLPWSWSSRVQ